MTSIRFSVRGTVNLLGSASRLLEHVAFQHWCAKVLEQVALISSSFNLLASVTVVPPPSSLLVSAAFRFLPRFSHAGDWG